MKRVHLAGSVLLLLGWLCLALPRAHGGEEPPPPKEEQPAKAEPSREAPKEGPAAKAEPSKEATKEAPPAKEEPAEEVPKATPAPTAEEEPGGKVTDARQAWPWADPHPLRFEGTITERYRIRDTAGESDQDLETVADLTVKNLFKGKLDLYFRSGVFWDLWGRQDSKHRPETFYFADAFDTYAIKAQGRIYALYAEMKEVAEGLDLRLGRHSLHKGEHLHFDGLSLSYSPSPIFEVTVGGGLPVYYSEAQCVTNFVGAAYVEFFPGFGIEDYPDRATKLTLEYIHVHEGKQDENLDEDYMSIRIWQRLFGNAVAVFLKGGFLNGLARDFSASVTARCPFTGLNVNFRYRHYPTKWGEVEDGERENLTIDFSHFLGVMGAYNPYQQVALTVYKAFSPFFAATLAYSGRAPLKDRYESDFNHDFDRYSGTLHFHDPFKIGLDASVTAEFWTSDGPTENDNNLTWGFDLAFRPSDKVSVTVGSHFLKYRVVYEPDPFTRISEKSDVRVLSVGIDVRPCPFFRAGVRYELESDEGWLDKSFDTLLVRATFRF